MKKEQKQVNGLPKGFIVGGDKESRLKRVSRFLPKKRVLLSILAVVAVLGLVIGGLIGLQQYNKRQKQHVAELKKSSLTAIGTGKFDQAQTQLEDVYNNKHATDLERANAAKKLYLLSFNRNKRDEAKQWAEKAAEMFTLAKDPTRAAEARNFIKMLEIPVTTTPPKPPSAGNAKPVGDPDSAL